MGDDSVIECVRDGDTINAFVSFTTPSTSPSSPRDAVRYEVVDVGLLFSIYVMMSRGKVDSITEKFARTLGIDNFSTSQSSQAKNTIKS